ncbi:hypothetical protein [Phormidium tenue]|uniref:DNA-binding protein n=1 Tax=Phormidium tenue NIES-30 TaxID=549789 RepID=A0A1U7IYF1_9CYAN|nr:hypothetical protein [Phormidium tenue]MBD2234879.1 hypothetical protein [Phormidium tenue FACHB-1052]OKH43619.1 hypothetical protein NIES30_24575 [Phormidium tenue NIES-30]
MTTDDKAKRAPVAIGQLSVDGFQMPDGSYRMSQTQAAESVGLSERNAREFLQSKSFKALMGEGYTPAISDVEVEPDPDQTRGQTRIRGLELEAVSAYWLWQAYKGNKAALALCIALMTETLERRFDAAFGVERSESDRNALLTQRLQQTEADLTALGEAYALPDVLIEDNERLRAENQVLREQVQELGGQPGKLPGFPPS